MKKAMMVLGEVVFVLGILVSTVNAADKFGFIELGKIFNEYNKTKDYDKVLSGKENAYETERDKKVDEIKQLQDKMNLLSDKEKETKKTDLEDKIKSLQEFDRQKQADLRKESNEKRAEVMKDIDSAIKSYAAKEGYTLVFNEVGVVYNSKEMDITDKIIELLNKGYKK